MNAAGSTRWIRVWAVVLLNCLLCLPVYAQKKRHAIHWGASVPVAAKFQLLPADATHYDFWGNVSFSLLTHIEGAHEDALSLWNHAGYTLDFTAYEMPGGGLLLMDRASLFIHPQIVLPTRLRKWKVTAGIGLEWNAYFMVHTGIEGTQELIATAIAAKRRRLFPYVSAGLLYTPGNGFYFHIFARQMMTGYYAQPVDIRLFTTSTTPEMTLNDKPTFLGFSFSYLF